MTLFGGLAVPFERLGIVLRNTPAFEVNDPKVVLGWGYILLGGFAVPLARLGIVLRHALTYVDIFPR